MKTAVFNVKAFERQPLECANMAARHEMTFFDEPLNSDTVHLANGITAVAVSMHDQLNAEVLSALSRMGVRLVTLRCAGFDNVDTIAAVSENITLMRVPAYSPEAVAEHAVALILNLTRKTHIAYRRTRENNFLLNGLMGVNLYGKTVGVIGTGNIGGAFCRIMIGFGCNVLAFDINKSARLKKMGVMYKSLAEVLRGSDIVSIHCPLNKETHHLFNKENLSLMKKGAMLINTARGDVVDEAALVSALEAGQIAGAGLDVYEREPAVSPQLLKMENVVLLPHLGSATVETRVAMGERALANIVAWAEDRPLPDRVV
jgi:D-lactate dehydrogenase